MPAQQSSIATMLGLHGDNPKKLDLIDLDPSKIQLDTIRGNMASLPEAERLASQVNQFSTAELLKTLERMMPGYASLRDSVTGSISSMARGELPKDVENLLQRKAAEKGITLGTSGSQFQSFDALRSLGLTSLDITRQGLSAATSWIASAPRAPQFDVTSTFFTPQQRLQFEFNQAQANLPIRQFNNWVDTLPSNVERGVGQFLDWVAQTASSVGEMYAGGGMGGMMGGGGAAAGGAGVNTSSKLGAAMSNYGL